MRLSANSREDRRAASAGIPDDDGSRVDWWLLFLLQCITIPQTFYTPGLIASTAVSLIMVARRPAQSLSAIGRYWPTYALVLLALASVFWSEQPDKTLRTGISALLFAFSAIVFATRVGITRAVSALFLASFVMAIIQLAVHRTGNAVEGLVPIGLMGAKNGFSFFGQQLLLLCLAMALDGNQPKPLRLLSLPATLIALYILAATHSAGGMVSAAIGSAILIAMVVIGKAPPRMRALCLVALVVVCAPLAASHQEVETAASDFSQDVLKKDTTLTGRAYLWYRAQPIIGQKPVLGHGFQAFWTQGNEDAEGLWNWAKNKSRAGFNFHNTYIEMQVDLGMVGLIGLIGMLAITVLLSAAAWLTAPNVSLAWMFAAMVALLSRTPTESMISSILPQIATWLVYAWVGLKHHSPAPLATERTATRERRQHQRGATRGPVPGRTR
uniref:O-antigen polymerase n=1 Tax=Caulobacter sp. (strain K31) TaxID=366602 RepID=B0T437_CAUSK